MLVGKKSSIFRNTMCTVGSARPEIHNGKKNDVVIIYSYTLKECTILNKHTLNAVSFSNHCNGLSRDGNLCHTAICCEVDQLSRVSWKNDIRCIGSVHYLRTDS